MWPNVSYPHALQVVPVDASSESLLELMELCDEGRHIDLDYSDFRAVSGSVTAEPRTTDDYQQIKKVSFSVLIITFIPYIPCILLLHFIVLCIYL